MALSLQRFESLCHRLPIRDRDTGRTVPFIFTEPQKHIMREVLEHRRDDMPLQVALYKSRRTGGSTWAVALLVAHCLAKAGAKAAIVAQLDKTAKELYEERAIPFAEALKKRGVNVEITKSEIRFHFPNGRYSKLYRATAKTVIGGRGLTASAVLLSEAAFYPGEDSFVSILNALSKDPDNIIIIETTPNGIEGPGEAFYNYWNDAVEGVNGFIPIFMPWHEDSGLCLSDDMASDAPRDEYERWLMKEFKCTKGQIAWYRWTMTTKCAGSHDRMKQENPSNSAEGFIFSGTPAFDSEEQSIAIKHVRKPVARGTMRDNGEAVSTFEEASSGQVILWDYPQKGHSYYAGVDAAKGVGTGDFAAISIYDGETGEKVCRWADRVAPERTAYFVNGLCRWFNNAMVNIEFTGGWGYNVAKELRDNYFYPAQYLWRSRDENINAKPRQSMGWETTERSRRMLIDLFRLALRRRELKTRDQQTIAQMSRCSMELGWRWTVIKGHDDILMSDFLAWVCVEQYHTPMLKSRHSNTMDKGAVEDTPGAVGGNPQSWPTDPFVTGLGTIMAQANTHLKQLERYNRNAKRGDPLEGLGCSTNLLNN